MNSTTPKPARTPHLARLVALVLVFLGGALGTASRQGLALLFPPVESVPYTILAINVLGAFLLGLLLESLAQRGTEQRRHRVWRLLVGTGFMGGFTTYSALAVDTALLLGGNRPLAALAYALGTVVLGFLAAAAGIILAATIRRSNTRHGRPASAESNRSAESERGQ